MKLLLTALALTLVCPIALTAAPRLKVSNKLPHDISVDVTTSVRKILFSLKVGSYQIEDLRPEETVTEISVR